MDSESHYYKTFSARLFSKLVDYPKLCLLTLLGLSLLCFGGYYDAKWPSKLKDKLVGNSANADEDKLNATNNPMRPRRFRGSSGGGSGAFGQADTLLVIESSQLFSYEGAQALRSIVAALEKLPTIQSVTWMDNSPPLNIFGLPEPVVPRGHASEQRFKLAKEKALKNPLVAGQFLSDNAQTTVMSIGFNWPFVHRDSDCSTAIVEAAKSAMADHPAVQMNFSTTGPVPIRLMLVADRASNELKFQLIAYGIILLMAIILFRGFTVVLVVAMAPVVGVIWTLGMLRYFDLQDNPFSDVIVPVLVSLVGFTDAVHMMVFLRGQLQLGYQPVEACRRMLAAVGKACFLTSLTTAIGMGSLLLAHHEIVREFGWSCIIGVTATWISVMLIIPMACFTPWANWLSKGSDRGVVEANLSKFVVGIEFIISHSKLVSIAAIVILMVLTSIALRLRPDDRTSYLMPAGSEASQALAKLDQALGGLDVCQISIDWIEDKVISPEQVIKMISQVDLILDDEPLIGHPLSICKLLKAMPGDDPPEEKLSLAELLPPPLKLAVYDSQEGHANVIFRVRDLGTATYKPIFERIQSKLDLLKAEHPQVSFEMSGSPIWKWRDLYQIVVDLVTSMASASVVIFGVMGLAFRSIRIGLISILPNMLPLSAAAAVLVFVGKPLEMVSVCALTICLGIAVDDTIHFITRYQEEQSGSGSRNEKILRAFNGVGSGLIMTSIVLVAGFGSVLMSKTPEHQTFALMGVVTIFTALLGDLFLLPALLHIFDKEPPNKH